MVDLVKIRKKAKERKEKGVIPSEARDPQPTGETPASPEPGGSLADARDDTVDKLAAFLASAGERRVEASKQSDQSAADGVELLTFSIGGETYAVDIEHVVEIVTPRAVTRVPNADSSVVGILSLRGTIVTLIDVRRRLNHVPSNQTPETRVVVVDRNGDNLGFVVDRVLRVAKIASSEIDPHPVVHSSEHDDSVRGVFRIGDALTILLDLDKLLAGHLEVAPVT